MDAQKNHLIEPGLMYRYKVDQGKHIFWFTL